VKKHLLHCQAWLTALCCLATGSLLAAELHGEPPPLDKAGRFWVYRDGTANPRMPFSPYGWMSDAAPSDVIQLDLECHDSPHVLDATTAANGDNTCLRLTVNWTNATWAAVSFISGPDKPAWWGNTNGGTYYDLRKLHRKKLIAYLRGDKGGERVTVKLGILAQRPFGDSLAKPIASDLLELSTSWQRYELDLSAEPPEELSHICNGFGILLERSSQPGESTRTRIYLDNIYFE